MILKKQSGSKKKRNIFMYLKSSESSFRYVFLKNNWQINKNKLKLMKFDPLLNKKTLFVETSIKKAKK